MAPVSEENDDDDSSSGGDIPYRKPAAKEDANDANGNEEDEGDDEEGEGEEEYLVEKIIGHQQIKGKLYYEVKWVGYDDTTTEPAENLDSCPDELKAYYKKHPELDPNNKKRKRKSGAGASPSTSAPSSTTKKGFTSAEPKSTGGRKRTKLAAAGPDQHITDSGKKGEKTAPYGTWENDVYSIDTMERDAATGDLIVYVMWKDGTKSKHPSRIMNNKCPQMMLKFYEAHIIFNSGQPATVAPTAAGMSSDAKVIAETQQPKTEDGTFGGEEDEEMEDIKGVASR